jgi:hypothetical protein
LVELLKGVNELAVNDQIKQEIYFEHSMSSHLRTILHNGNEVEIEYASDLLYQLCFDKKISQDVLQDTELMNKLKSLEKESKKAQSNCEGICWLISKNSEINKTDEEKNVDSEKKGCHIMISYNRNSRSLCLSIKEELEKQGFKVWIDVEDIHGSSLESMANAIEQSACVHGSREAANAGEEDFHVVMGF